jgi:hypothetical protein
MHTGYAYPPSGVTATFSNFVEANCPIGRNYLSSQSGRATQREISPG